MRVDPNEMVRLREKGYGIHSAREILLGNELRRLVAEMLVDQSWIKLSQILIHLIDAKFPKEDA